MSDLRRTAGLFGRTVTDRARYVVSKRRTGLGDCLVSLISAWWYAKQTGRTLVIDWRGSRYLTDPMQNAFPHFFEVPEEIDGVPVIADGRVADLKAEGPYYPPIWMPETLHLILNRSHDAYVQARDAADRLVRDGRDIDAQVVVFDTCMNMSCPDDGMCRRFLSCLRPVPSVCRAVAAFREARLGGSPAIGVHIRRGNGGDMMEHAKFWRNPKRAIAACVAYIDWVREYLGGDAVVFLCTDSRWAARQVDKRVPGLLMREKYFMSEGKGDLHSHLNPHREDLDVLVELLLLAHVDVLIRFPRDSFFSAYGRLMKPARASAPPDFLSFRRRRAAANETKGYGFDPDPAVDW